MGIVVLMKIYPH